MSETEPSLLSVKDLPEATQLTTVELDPPEGDTHHLLSEDEQDTGDDNGTVPIQKDWSIQSRLHQRKAKW